MLRFTIHETIIQNLKSVTIGATADGLALPPQQFINPGQYTYTRDVPAEHLQRDGVLIEFALDHALPPSAADSRELGVIVNEVGLEVK